MREIFAIIKKTRYYIRSNGKLDTLMRNTCLFLFSHLLRAGVKDVPFFSPRFFYVTVDCHFVPQRKFNYPIRLERSSRIHAHGRFHFEEEKATKEKVSEPVASILLDVTVPLCEKKKENKIK